MTNSDRTKDIVKAKALKKKMSLKYNNNKNCRKKKKVKRIEEIQR